MQEEAPYLQEESREHRGPLRSSGPGSRKWLVKSLCSSAWSQRARQGDLQRLIELLLFCEQKAGFDVVNPNLASCWIKENRN